MPKKTNVIILFTKKDDKITVCKLCLKEEKFCGNTSDMFKHMKNHPSTSLSKNISMEAEVFKARHRSSNSLVALKKVLMENEKEGFPITAIREIKILQALKHENIVNLIEVCTSRAAAINGWKSDFYLVFDFCEHDLAGLLSNNSVKFNLEEIKMIMKQLLNALYFLHARNFMHRDMKAANILITKDGILKLADFGLARPLRTSQLNRYTNRVVTLWYRPPEILLGDRNYGPPADVWGVGCIMAELWTRRPILQGLSEQHQLAMISQLCGCITPETFPGVEKLDLYNKMELPKGYSRRLKDRLRVHLKDENALDLVDKFLVLDPTMRIDSDNALNHDFFWTDPMPVSLAGWLAKYKTSMFEYVVAQKRLEHCRRQGPNQGKGAVTNNDEYFDRIF